MPSPAAIHGSDDTSYFLYCARQDLNLHEIAPASPSS